MSVTEREFSRKSLWQSWRQIKKCFVLFFCIVETRLRAKSPRDRNPNETLALWKTQKTVGRNDRTLHSARQINQTHSTPRREAVTGMSPGPLSMSQQDSASPVHGCSPGSCLPSLHRGLGPCVSTQPGCERPGLTRDSQPSRGRAGELFLPSTSRSLALTQNRVQHLSCFSTAQGGSFAPGGGRAAGAWTQRACSSTPFSVSYKGKHWCLGLELQKPCLNTITEM